MSCAAVSVPSPTACPLTHRLSPRSPPVPSPTVTAPSPTCDHPDDDACPLAGRDCSRHLGPHRVLDAQHRHRRQATVDIVELAEEVGGPARFGQRQVSLSVADTEHHTSVSLRAKANFFAEWDAKQMQHLIGTRAPRQGCSCQQNAPHTPPVPSSVRGRNSAPHPSPVRGRCGAALTSPYTE